MSARFKCSAAACAAVLVLSGCSKSAQYYFDSGNRYYEQKHYSEAIVQFRSAIAKDPKFGEARMRLADSYVAVGDGANAGREYVRAADLLPDNVGAQIKAGQVLLGSGRFDDARATAQHVLEKNPKNIEAQVLRGNALAGLKDIDGAIADVEEAVKTDPTRGMTYANLGMLQLVKGNRVEAEAAFKKSVSNDPQSVTARLGLANFYWATQRAAEAEDALKQAVALEPQNVAANRALAIFYLASGRAPQAEAPLRVVASSSTDTSAKFMLADYYMSAGRNHDASVLLEGLVRGDTTFAPAKLRLAAIAFSEKRKDDAYKIVREVLARNSKDVDALVTQSRFLLADGRTDEALVSAKRAVTYDGRSVEARLLLGRLHELRNELDDAIAAFNEVLKMAPRATGAKLELARTYLAKGDGGSALEHATQAAAEQPSADAGVLVIRALLLRGNISKASDEAAALSARYPNVATVQAAAGLVAGYKNDKPAAQRAFQTALKIDPDNRDALAGLVALDLSQHNFQGAQSRIEKEIARRGDDAQLLLLLGRTRSVAGDTAGAEEALKKAIIVAPSTLEAYGLLGQMYFREKRLDQALAEFDRLASRDPKSVAAHTVAAMILQLQNKPDEARKRYEKVLELNPRAAVAANNLAWMYAESNQSLDIALQLAQTAKSQLPDQPEVNDTLGWIYTKKGLPELAIPALLASIEKDPNNAAYHFHLGVAYSKTGNKEKARTSLERASTLGGDSAEARDARKLLASISGS